MFFRVLTLLALTVLTFPAGLPAQTEPGPTGPLQTGLTIQGGLGRYSVRDEYFSAQKYTGTLPSFAASWGRFHPGGGYRLGIDHRTSSEIRNHNLSAGVTSFSLDLDFLYRVTTVSLFSRDAHLFLGPSTGFFLHFSELHIAFSELEIPYSFAFLLPLGINSTLALPMTDRLRLAASFRSTLLSLGLRMIDLDEDVETDSPLRFLTFPSGTNATFRLGAQYGVTNRLSLDFGYELRVLRIGPWDPLLSAGDNLVAGFTVGF